MEVNLNPRSFSVNMKGDRTKATFQGMFTTKVLLTKREELTIDRIKRDLLGPNPSLADSNPVAIASIIAELSVRLTEAPKWWSDSSGGLDLRDENVIASVYEQVMKAEKDALDGVKEEGSAAKQEIKTLVTNSAPAVNLSQLPGIDLNKSSIG